MIFCLNVCMHLAYIVLFFVFVGGEPSEFRKTTDEVQRKWYINLFRMTIIYYVRNGEIPNSFMKCFLTSVLSFRLSM